MLRKLSVMAALVILSASTSRADIKSATVNVRVQNVKSSVGTIHVALCKKALTPEGCEFFVKIAPGATPVATFDNVSPGHWAVAVFHDLNEDGKMNTILGVPQEPYGLSNEAAAAKLIPGVDDALVEIQPGTNDLDVSLQGLLGK